MISVGCDCHPAYVLRALQLRTSSFPFDWLNTGASAGIAYVNANIRSEFRDCVEQLTLNEFGKVISARYPETEFTHFDGLIGDPLVRQTLMRRAERFLEVFHRRECEFLYTLPSFGLSCREDVSRLVSSVNEFLELSQGRHRLLVYVRYDESLEENEEHCQPVAGELSRLPGVTVANYIRGKERHGIWGDPGGYPALLSSLGIGMRG